MQVRDEDGADDFEVFTFFLHHTLQSRRERADHAVGQQYTEKGAD